MLPQIIRAQRLILRPFRESDVQEVFQYLQDREMGRYLEGSTAPPTKGETAKIIARHIQVDWSQRGVWAMTINDLPVGGVSLNFLKAHRVAEIGYSVKKALWGQGFAFEAAGAVIAATLETHLELRRIQAGIHPSNRGSIRVAEKLGMEYEGTLRAYSDVRGEIADEAIYAFLRDDNDA